MTAPVCSEATHDRFKRDSDVWALLVPLGTMPTFKNDGTHLELANCPRCHSTLAKEVKHR